MWYYATMRQTINPITRFNNNYKINANGCWIWQKYLNKGYARFNNGEKIVDAHRWFYQIYNQTPLNKTQHLDHLCRIRHCVNPEHLEIVTNRENWLRGKSVTRQKSKQTHCIHGHELIGVNVYTHNNKRRCNVCHKLNERTYRTKK